MKVSELIAKLSEYDGELDVNVVISIPPSSADCQCEDYCYCSYSEVERDVCGVSERTCYNPKSRKHNVTGLTLTKE